MDKPRRLKPMSAEWKEEYVERLKTMSNDDLLSTTLSAACADEPTNTFSKMAEFEADVYTSELYRRLKEAGWLTMGRPS